MRIKDLLEDERPREKMLSQGPGSLSNSELLAILLRSGNRNSSALELAQELLKTADGTLSCLFNMSAEQLCSLPGIGQGKVSSIIASFELGKRFLKEESFARKKPIVSARSVFEMMLPQLKGLKHEEFWILLLNDSNFLIRQIKVTSGGINSTVIDVRQVIRFAIELNASGIILIHNHPSGNPLPSDADRRQTELMHKAAKTCKLQLLDHVIICDDRYYSFAESST